MPITNEKIYNELQYIKGKMDAEEEHSKEHREWEVGMISDIKENLSEMNSRINSNENAINWFKGIGATLIFLIGWLFKK